MKVVQFHRMSSAQAGQYTGPQGEVIVDTGSYAMRVQDGITPGGYRMMSAALNLSDLEDFDIARNNLGAAPIDNPNFTTNAQIGGDDIVTKNATQTLAAKTLNSPLLVTAFLGTPNSGNLANCTGYAKDNLTGLDANVKTMLGQAPSGSGGFLGKTTPVITDKVFVGNSQLIGGLDVNPVVAGTNYDLNVVTGWSGFLILITWNAGEGFAIVFVSNGGVTTIVASSNAIGGNSAFDNNNSVSSNGSNGIAAFVAAGHFFIQAKNNYSAPGPVRLMRLG